MQATTLVSIQVAVFMALLVATTQESSGPGDVEAGSRPIWALVRPSDAFHAYLEHQAGAAPGGLAVVVDTGSTAALGRAKEAIAALQPTNATGPFIFATFHRTGVSEPRVLSGWSQLQEAVAAVTASRAQPEGRSNGPGPLDAVLGAAAVSPRGTRIVLVTEDGAQRSDADQGVVDEVARVLRAGGIQLDAWTLGSCNEYEAVTNVSRSTGGTLGCGDGAMAETDLKQVLLAVRRGQSGPLHVNVDSSVQTLLVKVRGNATLQSTTGRSWPLVANGDTLVLGRQDLQNAAGVWVLTPHGPRGSDAPLDAEVRALSRLDVSASLMTSQDPQGPQDDKTLATSQYTENTAGKVETIRLKEPQGVTIDLVKLLDVSGQELGSATRSTNYKAAKQISRRALPPGQTELAELAGGASVWDVKTQHEKPFLVETTGHSNGEIFTRVSNLTRLDNVLIVMPPLEIELTSESQLIARQGQQLQLRYQITNNRDFPQLLHIHMSDELAFLTQVLPVQQLLQPRQTMPAVALLRIAPNAADGQVDTVNFYARSVQLQQEIRKGAFLYVQQEQTNDGWSPSIWGTWKSTCSGAWDPSNCNTNTWTIDFSIQDKDSGVLRINSNPRGVQFRTDFISGTREVVRAYYTASCCSKRVDIEATDLRGNTNRQNYDVGTQFFSPGEIAGITLGVIAIILIVAIIVLAVMLCRRRESLRLERRLSSRLAARDGH